MIDLSEINLRIRSNLKRYREVALDLELHNDTEENKQKTKTKTKFSENASSTEKYNNFALAG
ncbi:hypothetical protein [Prevotella nigrescens]|jgi:hypothetical protein|uniref:hypothetical protein n=1 Tax=Prevotella nigrescens TaxID=28133 RepID=UPI0028D7F503|nr:hypothetical protein [Prevotella nigrescens]